MSDDLVSGWLPIDALEDEQARQRDASGAEADRLLAMSERAMALELMRLARADAGAARPLRPADLARVLARYAGGEMPSEEALRGDFPGLSRDANVPDA